MAGLCISYEGAWGPRVRCKRALPKNGGTGAWCVVSLKKIWKKGKEKDEEVVAEKDA